MSVDPTTETPSSSTSPTTCKSHCLCGQISFSLRGIQGPCLLCYCTNCQRASGSPCTWLELFRDAHVNADKGQELMRKFDDWETKSGKVLERWFCSVCVRH